MKFFIATALLALIVSTTIAQQKAKLRPTGTSKQLVVNGTPTIVLGGELGNSSATCVADIENNFSKVAQFGINTILVPISWDLIEPIEGKFDYTLVDKIIEQAEQKNLNVILLWFGAWKNSVSCCVPAWLKQDGLRFPRMYTSEGKTLEMVSLFTDNVLTADMKALGHVLEHINKIDENNRVIMVQLENEIGMLESARDFSPSATDLYNGAVPETLIKYLTKNKELLHPSMIEKWGKNGYKTSGTWTSVFGDDIYTEEIFMAYHYAKYIGELAKNARFQYNIPIFVNAALNSRNRKPGEYPSAGPLAHLIDIWHCVAPSIDILAPDIYDEGFASWTNQYALFNNPLFIPEMRLSEDNGVQAFYAIGEHEAIGVSPFSIENANETQALRIKQAYNKINELTPLLSNWYGKTALNGFLFNKTNPKRIIEQKGIRIIGQHLYSLPWFSPADNSSWPAGGGLLLRLNDLEYIVAGSGLAVTFESDEEPTSEQQLGEDGFAQQSAQSTTTNNKWFGARRLGILSVDEVAVDNKGNLQTLRHLNGDETHQGRHVRIDFNDFKILHVKLYEYK